MTTHLDPTTPVLIGWHQLSRRDTDPHESREAADLMASAVRGALASTQTRVAADRIGWVGATAGLTKYADPGRLVAEKVGAVRAHTVLAQIGVLQQTLVARACEEVRTGASQLALVVGGEAQYRKVRWAAAGETAPVTAQSGATHPDEVISSPEFDDAMSHPAETSAGLAATPAYYALIDSFWRAEQGRSIDGHRDELARIYARFAEIAADNPHAVRRQGYTPQQIRTPSADNPMIAFPYTKLMVTTWTVDQACALLFTTAGHAAELGVPRRRWRFPVIAVEHNHVVPVSARTRLSQPSAMRIISDAVHARTGIDTASIDLVDLYSAFPAPVSIAAAGLGLPPGRDLTLTGGMSFAGGPLNSYVFHAIAAAAERLAEPSARTALVSSVSGLYTKQGVLVLAKNPLEAPFQTVDVTAEVASAEPAIAVVTDARGRGTVVAYTVVCGSGGPECAIMVLDLASGGRAVARSHDPAVIARASTEDLWGAEVLIADGVVTLARTDLP